MNRIKEIRQEKNLSQTDIAKALGVTRQAISLYEKGDREPKLETWQKLADFFDVSVSYLQGIGTIRDPEANINTLKDELYKKISSNIIRVLIFF